MRYGKRLGLSAILYLLVAGVALAADFGGTYRSPQITLQLTPAGDAYTGTLTIREAAYPVTAKENAGAIDGVFTSQGTRFDFSARLDGDKLTIRTSGKSYELKREPAKPAGPANPFEQVGPPEAQPPAPKPEAQTPAAQTDQGGPTGDAAIAALKDLGPARADPKRDWLMLVYLDGDNNLDHQGAYNIKQMERGFPDSGVDVIVLYDRPIRKEKDGKLTHPKLFRVARSQRTDYLDSEVLKDLGGINMADPRILAGFIEGAVKAFPARQHAMFTWNHGGGWSSLTVDENAPGRKNNFDAMDMPRFRTGLTAGMQASGLKKWDIIAFDMCLMAQFEVAAEIHDLTDVMVASEALEPGKGMPYTQVLEAFGKGTLGGRRIGANIVAEFDKFHKNDGVRSTTLSALDMSVFDEANTRLNALVDKLIPAMPQGWSSLAKSYFYAEQYADSRDDFRQGKNALQSIDLLDALRKCRSAMANFPAENEYKDLVQTMDRFIIASANSQRRQMSNGLAIYAPVIKEAYNPEYDKLAFAKISHWPKLIQSLYPEQAKNDQAPRFGKIELVNHEDKPVGAVRPMSGMATTIEVEGKNIVWVRHMAGVRDAEFGGVRVMAMDYVIDANFMAKIAKGAEKYSQDVDLIMPQMIDGLNKLREPQFGLTFLMNNGEKNLQAMFDNSDLKDPTSFSVLVLMEHPSIGDKPVRAILHGDGVSLSVTSTTLIQTAPDGRLVRQQFDPPADAKITPLFWLYKDDGSRELCAKGSFNWNKGMTFTIDVLPAGEYEEIYTAETIGGASTTARFRFKAEVDENMAKARESWKSFQSEMMVGTWEWAMPGDPPKTMGMSMTLEATKQPFAYEMAFDTPTEDGKRKITKGLLIMEIHDQPYFRLITAAEGQGRPGVILGTMWWAPQGNTSHIMTRSILFNFNILWQKKGGKAPGPPPGPFKPDPDKLDGWKTIADANRQVSLSVPATFVTDEKNLKRAQAVLKGYDFTGLDENLGAAVEIIRFDGVNDARRVIEMLFGGAQQLGVQLQLGRPQVSKLGDLEFVSFGGSGINAAGGVFNVGINLIPTPKGIVAVNFACAPQTARAAEPMLKKIWGTIKVAK